MKSRTFKIESKNDIQLVTDFLHAQPEKPVLEVFIKKYQPDITAKQRAYYWTILTTLCDEMGILKNEAHELYKERFLVKIFERDDPGYAEMISAIRKVHTQGFKQDAKAMYKQIVRLTSITSATVKQMREYITDIFRDGTSQGIALPHPDDLGRK